jgi:hypothetical protein
MSSKTGMAWWDILFEAPERSQGSLAGLKPGLYKDWRSMLRHYREASL